MLRSALACVALLSCALAAGAATYYVSSNGQQTNDGTRESPWPSVLYALKQVGSGHTIVVLPGTYREPIRIDPEYGGTEQTPTVIKSETKWKAAVIGSTQHCIWTEPDCDWVVIDGFEVFGARSDGIKLCGDNSVVRNCWVHNNVSMGIASHGRSGNVFRDNLVEYNGSHVQFHHGMYISGDGHRIVGNIVRHNAGWGLHLYQEISNSLIANNLVHGHAHRPGMILRCPEGGGRNVVVNNTIVDNGAGIDIARGNGEILANNILGSRFDPISLHQGTVNLLADYSLCNPASEHQGSHGLTGDPLFVAPEKGVYWLQPESPAIGKGSTERAPDADFWGRPLPADRPPDIGCFAFVEVLATPEARKTWYYQWAYQFYPNREMGLPDLWRLPQQRQ